MGLECQDLNCRFQNGSFIFICNVFVLNSVVITACSYNEVINCFTGKVFSLAFLVQVHFD